MITIQNTNLISKTAQRRHAFMEAYFLTEHCGIMAGTAFHPNWTSDLLSWDQLQLHVAKSELAIFAMSQFLFLFFSLTPTNSINIPSVSKVRKSWEFYFFLFLAIYYLPNPVDSTSEIFLKLRFLFILMSIGPVWNISQIYISCFSWIDHVVPLPLSFVPTN